MADATITIPIKEVTPSDSDPDECTVTYGEPAYDSGIYENLKNAWIAPQTSGGCGTLDFSGITLDNPHVIDIVFRIDAPNVTFDQSMLDDLTEPESKKDTLLVKGNERKHLGAGEGHVDLLKSNVGLGGLNVSLDDTSTKLTITDALNRIGHSSFKFNFKINGKTHKSQDPTIYNPKDIT